MEQETCPEERKNSFEWYKRSYFNKRRKYQLVDKMIVKEECLYQGTIKGSDIDTFFGY